MRENVTLLYLRSDVIERFIEENPIDWGGGEAAQRANSDGNLFTPIPAMFCFFDFLNKRKSLFTQSDYARFSYESFGGWVEGLEDRQKHGLIWRLKRNFYPSAIDSLHVWALLVESGKFDSCTLDVQADAVGKKDLTCKTKDGATIKIQLKGCRSDTAYFFDWRKWTSRGIDSEALEIWLPWEREKKGGKRWYNWNDLAPILCGF